MIRSGMAPVQWFRAGMNPAVFRRRQSVGRSRVMSRERSARFFSANRNGWWQAKGPDLVFEDYEPRACPRAEYPV